MTIRPNLSAGSKGKAPGKQRQGKDCLNAERGAGRGPTSPDVSRLRGCEQTAASRRSPRIAGVEQLDKRRIEVIAPASVRESGEHHH
jgi:hypothetical protein